MASEPKKPKGEKKESRYAAIQARVFHQRYVEGQAEVPFHRTDLEEAAAHLNVRLPKNVGDVVYSARYRAGLPASIVATQPPGFEWIIEGKGQSKYAFRLTKVCRISPNEHLVKIKIPDSTPEIITAYALSDEQALLAKVRYNRLLDVFLGFATFSLQSHLRTYVEDLGQIEIDEVYVGVDRGGRQYVIPVQAKGGNDNLSWVQARQDMRCCADKFPALVCRAISAQFMKDGTIALFELTEQDGSIKIADEAHYRLVPASDISADDLRSYGIRG
ncbi:MAG: endonuclease [Verrucomicrobia bacterium]|nr:endonuclease [Verrucomicrobiota bacterium]